ncbi:MAG: hypothetical protein Q9212_002181 [Teloschistes hypoglaucus]
MAPYLVFTNGRICYHGTFQKFPVYVDTSTGLIIPSPSTSNTNSEIQTIDLRGRILAPAFLELQTNGALGVHFTQFDGPETYSRNLERILPNLNAHASLMQIPSHSSIEEVYGDEESASAIKLITIAPELDGSIERIKELEERNIRVSLGHSAADFDSGMAALKAGGKSLTHVFNAMNPLHHRIPGLAGLIASGECPYYSVIADGIHLHAATLAMAYRANPPKCILITDSVEMAGLPDGLYPGHAQIPHQQRKTGNKVTIEGTDTLIGSCCSIDECVRNLVQWSGCSLAQAVRCATENIANMMEIGDRGMINEGRRADFVLLDDTGQVLETWIRGTQIYEKQ